MTCEEECYTNSSQMMDHVGMDTRKVCDIVPLHQMGQPRDSIISSLKDDIILSTLSSNDSNLSIDVECRSNIYDGDNHLPFNARRNGSNNLRRRGSWPCLTNMYNNNNNTLKKDLKIDLDLPYKRVGYINEYGSACNALVFKINKKKDDIIINKESQSDDIKSNETRKQYAHFRPLNNIKSPNIYGNNNNNNCNNGDEDTIFDFIPSAIVRKGYHRNDVVAINYGLIRIRNCNTCQEYDCIDKDNGLKFVVKLITKPSPCIEIYESLCEINHNSFVKVSQVLEDSILFYILLDSCNTIPLRDYYIANHFKLLQPDIIKNIILTILKGIAFIHSKKFILGTFNIDSVAISALQQPIALINNVDHVKYANNQGFAQFNQPITSIYMVRYHYTNSNPLDIQSLSSTVPLAVAAPLFTSPSNSRRSFSGSARGYNPYFGEICKSDDFRVC